MALMHKFREINKVSNVVAQEDEEEHDEEYYYNLQFNHKTRSPDEPKPETGNPNVRKKHRPIIEEDEEEQTEPAPPPKKRKSNGIIFVDVDDDETDNAKVVTVTTPITSVSKLKGQAEQHKSVKVRMTTDITKELHSRLRIHAIRTDKNVIQIIEGWIKEFCPG